MTYFYVKEQESHLLERLQQKGVNREHLSLDQADWSCCVEKKEGETVLWLEFQGGAKLCFVDEAAAADFLYFVFAHGEYLQMLATDFGGLMEIIGGGAIHSTAWEDREQLPFAATVLSTNILPDEDDEERCMQIMDETDNELMERFSPASQLVLIFAAVSQEERRLFWVE